MSKDRQVRSLYSALVGAIAENETLALDCAEIAEREGDPAIADIARAVGRNGRIRALEFSGRLASLVERYPQLLDPEP
ncbi:hypothetical protein [Methylobacterium nodulans]|uniref:Uncharacterized protein n=1 Tax=Methylobacterium nodulans (strain LMG 21967 / CNCM I-2342 / ORS 2060) TaxID=460265 RepID=B8ISH3_METNO|nr:hypothetical protein [Methylobacterium nodulans]ACL58813.1 conserved hypothetical protein [Methylobacterium nodulans ORS 2060]